MSDGATGQLGSVHSFDPSISFVLLLEREGTQEGTARRGTAESLEPPEELERILEWFAIAGGMTAGSDTFFGRMLSRAALPPG